MKTVYFRVDMNKEIATGHMMRCLSIAEALKDNGDEAIFILADRNACGLLKEKGFDYRILHSRWDDLETELPAMTKLIKECNVESLVIDSYYATHEYLKKLTHLTETTYIDDLKRNDLCVNTVLAYSICAKREDYEKAGNANEMPSKLLIGPSYAPLRKAFCDIPDKTIRLEIQNILILSGGADPYGTVEKCIDTLVDLGQWEINAICGRYSELAGNLREKYLNTERIHIHGHVDGIEVLMQEADLCISAAGSTLYELCACGTPALSYTLADNQLDNAGSFSEKGIIPYLGDVRVDGIEDWLTTNIKVFYEYESRKMYSGKMRNVVDGMGCSRIIKEI